MNSKSILLLVFLSASLTGFSKTWQITNSDFTFTPATITITEGDDVNFSLESIHNAVEVSAATWTTNGSTSNGGFSVNYGGGLVAASQLTIGTHYYVCQPHASMGMKGRIIVIASTEVKQAYDSEPFALVQNPASHELKINVNDKSFLGSSYKLYGTIGKEVLNGILNSETNLIPVEKLSQGMYLLTISGRKTKIMKVIIRN